MTYIKEAFYPQTLQQAKDICITPNNNNPNKVVLIATNAKPISGKTPPYSFRMVLKNFI